jgi:hypothetical protein
MGFMLRQGHLYTHFIFPFCNLSFVISFLDNEPLITVRVLQFKREKQISQYCFFYE